MTTRTDDPRTFPPTLGDIDLHLIGEGRHEKLWNVLGAHVRTLEGVEGVSFAVWAPAARAVAVTGDFCGWDQRALPLRPLGSSGVWEGFVPAAAVGDRYKYVITTQTGAVRLKADPMAFATELPPATASVVAVAAHEWGDDAWMAARAAADPTRRPLSIYEVHLGSWRRNPDPRHREGLPLGYRELGEQLAAYCNERGFTHVELLPVAEHPFGGSWGYQVSSYYAPTARYGSPDDFRCFVDTLHRAGVGVLVDWVPAHFPRDDWALGRFDGTALYEHSDPRQGEHPDWGTFVFNYGRTEVRNFLVANALYWLDEFHVDGLRVDAVASMLYLDYSRSAGQWVPNVHGGRENLEAVALLKETNSVVHRRHPGVLTVAEESTAWPGVTTPVDDGGLGFTCKWNMGWMHDTLQYFHHEPVHRSYHQNDLTFGLVYAWSERFVLPLSHDEVVHGKGSLLGKMPGDAWQRFANLRALFAWMWAHPGRKLLFMGGEFAQGGEWSHDQSLDWHLLDEPAHLGVRCLVDDLNRLLTAEPALWLDDDGPGGFAWVAADDAASSVLSFLRRDPAGTERPVLCVANLTPVPRPDYRIGVPQGELWQELLCSDDERYGGSGVHASGPGADPEVSVSVASDPIPMHGHQRSLSLTLPPLGVLWLAPA